MATDADTKRRIGRTAEKPAEASPRETVLETLLQLHIGFGALGRLDEASPLLYKLMELAYYTQPAQRRSTSSRGKTKHELKPALN